MKSGARIGGRHSLHADRFKAMSSLLLMHRFPSSRLQNFMRGVQAMPAMFCLLLLVLAMWPVWLWSIARLRDGSDEPLGLLALSVLLVALWWRRREWSQDISLLAVIPAAAFALCASLGIFALPMLLRAVMAVLAISCLLAGMARRQPLLPYFGLALLSLPLISSLQFYAGFPLRVVTAEASMWILQMLGLAVERSGSALMVEGRLVLVDAPCSGIHMAWTAYFMACLAAFSVRLPDRAFLLRLPLVGITVLAGNILRNTVLVLREAAGWDWPSFMHAAVGLIVLALVCAVIFRLMSRRASASTKSLFASANENARGHGKALLLLLLLPCALLPFAQEPAQAATVHSSSYVWPEHWDGQPLQPLPLTTVEQRFAAQFPGAIRRFNAGQQQLVLRQVASATRMLHPAGDCYRGLGYLIRDEHLEVDAGMRLSRCFIAERQHKKLRVCERITDSDGRNFTDTSSWYWSAVTAQSRGPWLAVTTAEAL